MDPEGRYSVLSAQVAAQRGELADWVSHFLASPGSDNALLAEQLPQELPWWAGPALLRHDRLQRLAGPPGDPVLCPVDEDYWDDRVEALSGIVEQGGDLPPVIASYRDGQFVLEDGNHRVEGIRRAGHSSAWTVVGFAQEEDRDRVVAEWLGDPEMSSEG